MSNASKQSTIVFAFTFFSFHQVTAQADFSKWQVGINAGAFIYQGDLTPAFFGSYRTAAPVFGLNVARVINPSFALRGNFAYGHLKGDDALYNDPAWRQRRNFRFATPVVELSAQLVWNIFGNNGNELGLRFSPYVFGGAGLSFINVSRDFSRIDPSFFSTGTKEQLGLATDIARTPPRVIPVLPLGIGVEYYLTPRLSLTGETTFRYTFTDYLDGVSFAGNAARRDYYHSHTIGLLYRFSDKEKLGCPVMN